MNTIHDAVYNLITGIRDKLDAAIAELESGGNATALKDLSDELTESVQGPPDDNP